MKAQSVDTGLEQWLEAVVKAGRDVDVVADRMVEAGAQVVHQAMVDRVPVDTGALKAHLEQTGKSDVEREGNLHSVEIGLLDLGTAKAGYGERSRKSGRKTYPREFLYGIILEYGSSSMAAQPYIRPAFDNTKAQQKQVELDALKASGLL